jgi:hypothetical protein
MMIQRRMRYWKLKTSLQEVMHCGFQSVLNSTMNTDRSVYLVKESILKAAASKGLPILQDLRYADCLGTF